MMRMSAMADQLLPAIKPATLEIELKLLTRALERRYSPDQPRVAAGNPDGGQWTSGGGGAGSSSRVAGGRPESRKPIKTALAGVLIMQRVGVGDSSLVRHCIYQDMFGRQYGFEQDAAKLCPPTFPTKPYYGPY